MVRSQNILAYKESEVKRKRKEKKFTHFPLENLYNKIKSREKNVDVRVVTFPLKKQIINNNNNNITYQIQSNVTIFLNLISNLIHYKEKE